MRVRQTVEPADFPGLDIRITGWHGLKVGSRANQPVTSEALVRPRLNHSSKSVHLAGFMQHSWYANYVLK